MADILGKVTEFELATIYSEWSIFYCGGNLLQEPDFKEVLQASGINAITGEETETLLKYLHEEHDVDCLTKYMDWVVCKHRESDPSKERHYLSYQLEKVNGDNNGVTEQKEALRNSGIDYKSDNGIYEWDKVYFDKIEAFYGALCDMSTPIGVYMTYEGSWGNMIASYGLDLFDTCEGVKMDVVAYGSQCRRGSGLSIPKDSSRAANLYIFYSLVTNHSNAIELVHVMTPLDHVRLPEIVENGMQAGILMGKTKQHWCKEFVETLLFHRDGAAYFAASPATYARVRLELFYETTRGRQNKKKIGCDWLPSGYNFIITHALMGHQICCASWEKTVKDNGPPPVTIPRRFLHLDEEQRGLLAYVDHLPQTVGDNGWRCVWVDDGHGGLEWAGYWMEGEDSD